MSHEIGVRATPVNGLGICTATGNQLSPTIAPDGAGGCIVAWSDQRSGTSRIFAQRINAGNVPLWTAGGLQISPNTGKQQSPAIVEDGENGAIISWADDSTGVFLVHATRVDGDGAVVWSRKVNPTALGQGGATLARDRESGTFICWEQAEPNFGNVYAMWLRHDDGFSDGPIAVSAEPNIVATGASAVFESPGHAMIVWRDFRLLNGVDGDRVWAQYIDTHALQWDSARALSSVTGVSEILGVAVDPDETGPGDGCMVAWLGNGANQIGAQRIDVDGNVAWGTDGVAFATGVADKKYLAMVAQRGSGDPTLGTGFLLAWREPRQLNDAGDLCVLGVGSDGQVGPGLWVGAGNVMCSAAGHQFAPTMASDGLYGAIVAWTDVRGSNGDIYVDHARWPGQFAVGVSEGDRESIKLSRPRPMPARQMVEFEVAGSSTGVSVAVFDVEGRVVRTLAGGGVRDAAQRTVRWDLRDGKGSFVRNGVYFIRRNDVHDQQVERVVVLR